MSKKAERESVMKYALIGCGRVSPNHINAAQKNGLEIVALCDVVREKAENIKKTFSLSDNVEIYTDYKLLLEKQKPDFVSIATVSGTHSEIAVYCAEHGVNFLVEKPMAMSMAEADEIIRAVEKNKVTAAVCHQNRFNIAVQELKNAIDEGRFGKISHGSVNIRWHRDEKYYLQDDWRGKWATDGGTLMNQCIHGMDLLRWLLGGEIDTVYGMTSNAFHPYIEAEDIGVAAVKFKNGVLATVEGTVNAVEDVEETLCIFGENGTVRLAGTSANAIDIWKFSDNRKDDEELRAFEEKTANVYGNGHTSMFLDVINSIKEKRKPYVDVYAGKNAVEFVLSVYKSQKTGEPVKLPLENFGSVDMTGEFE